MPLQQRPWETYRKRVALRICMGASSQQDMGHGPGLGVENCRQLWLADEVSWPLPGRPHPLPASTVNDAAVCVKPSRSAYGLYAPAKVRQRRKLAKKHGAHSFCFIELSTTGKKI